MTTKPRPVNELSEAVQKAGDDLHGMIKDGCFLRCRQNVVVRLREIEEVLDEVWSELDDHEYQRKNAEKRGFWARVFNRN